MFAPSRKKNPRGSCVAAKSVQLIFKRACKNKGMLKSKLFFIFLFIFI
jgi:hypothetical protein